MTQHHVYELPAEGDSPAAFAVLSPSRYFACMFEGRHVGFKLSSHQGSARAALLGTLKSRRELHDAIGDQPTYSGKHTLLAVKRRLGLLVAHSNIDAEEAEHEERTIAAKCHDLTTEHDWDRYLSLSPLARKHLDRCKRTNGDFEEFIAPRLCTLIERELHEEAKRREVGYLDPVIAGTGPACSKLAGLLQRNKWRPQSPFDITAVAGEVVAWAASAERQFEGLKAERDRLSSLLVEARQGVPFAEDKLRAALDSRGIPLAKADTLVELAGKLTTYLRDVETAVGAWQTLARKAQARELTARVDGGAALDLDLAVIAARREADLHAQLVEVQHRVVELEATAAEAQVRHADREAQLVAQVQELERRLAPVPAPEPKEIEAEAATLAHEPAKSYLEGYLEIHDAVTEPPRIAVADRPAHLINAAGVAALTGLPLGRVSRLITAGKGPAAFCRSGAGRGGARWYEPQVVSAWAARLMENTDAARDV